MIIRITFLNPENKTMLFGNSYKPWDSQAREFFRIFPAMLKNIDKIESSNVEWVSWGGLKWCSEDTFQKQLNREGCREGDPDNKTPRTYTKMVFRLNQKLIKKLY